MNLFNVYPLYDITPARAAGTYVWDNKGQKYLDLYGGHAVISIGHSHPHYVNALQEQVQKIGFYSNAVQNELQKALAAKLGQVSGYDEYRLFLCNSGAEANENALKLASFYNKRKKVIAFKNGFHGRTSLAAGVTDNPAIQAPVNQHDVIFLSLNDVRALEENLAEGDVCAVIIEGMQGIGGIHAPEKEFMQLLRALCHKHDTILILDEVQSGYGRTGKFFAHQHLDVRPDLITIAKGMGNGFPMGGVLINPRFRATHGMLGSTFGGNYLACAAGLAVLDVLEEENLMENAAKTGAFLMKELRHFDQVKEVRGKGLMIGIDLSVPVKEIRAKLLFNNHIFTGSAANKNTLRLLPPLGLTRSQAEVFLTSFAQVLHEEKCHEEF